MIEITNTNSKSEFVYKRYTIDEVDESHIKEMILDAPNLLEWNHRRRERSGSGLGRIRSSKIGKGKMSKFYLDISMAFDIETYTNPETELANMYTWQFGINQNVINGRRWDEFVLLLEMIKNTIKPTIKQRVIVWIHNASYEFQWIKKWLIINNPDANFFKDNRHVIYFTHDGWCEFRDSMAMTNSSLKKLANDFTNTQKCTGDLDYSKPFSSEDELTEIEQGYCDNDVLILTEWAQYFYNTYIINGFCPLTITGVLNHEVIEEAKKWCKESGINWEWWVWYIMKMKPQTEVEYKVLMSYLYRGGFTHSNQFYVDEDFDVCDGIAGFDFTSSYPASMTLCYYPGKWEYIEIHSVEEFESLCKSKCVYFKATFKGIKSTTDHTIESKSKCVDLVIGGGCIDNGRVREADSMTVYLTELDYETYKEFYRWDSMVISNVHWADRIECLPYLLKPMLNYYIAKDVLKKSGKPYAIEKAKVNTFYGLTVKSFNGELTRYTNESGFYEEDGAGFEYQNEKTLLPCFIGIYISAHSRRNLLKSTYQLEMAGYPVIYHDTDSIKILNFDDGAKRIIEVYNEDIRNRLIRFCESHDVPFENISDLGMYDSEYGDDAKHPVIRFKTLGAKRYIITYVEKNKFRIKNPRIKTITGGEILRHNQTIAGMPKNILFEGVNPEDWLDVYRRFEDDLEVNECKLRPVYIDDKTDVEVNGVIHHEKSSIALVKTDFTLSINDAWVYEYMMYKASKGNREQRII